MALQKLVPLSSIGLVSPRVSLAPVVRYQDALPKSELSLICDVQPDVRMTGKDGRPCAAVQVDQLGSRGHGKPDTRADQPGWYARCWRPLRLLKPGTNDPFTRSLDCLDR